MKKLIPIIFISFLVNAESYEAPSFKETKWKGPKVEYYKEKSWASDESIKNYKAPADPDEVDGSSLERKPSSGSDEMKPKFWDFKVVK